LQFVYRKKVIFLQNGPEFLIFFLLKIGSSDAEKYILMKKLSFVDFSQSQGPGRCTAQKVGVNFEQLQRRHFDFFQQ